jgi:hypothetical protein
MNAENNRMTPAPTIGSGNGPGFVAQTQSEWARAAPPRTASGVASELNQINGREVNDATLLTTSKFFNVHPEFPSKLQCATASALPERTATPAHIGTFLAGSKQPSPPAHMRLRVTHG